ncbi:unnamed protein product [Staurois parvus]|uniref:Uncharacterized protein n=1 Tax=Staurois parvus TaxID=386267 RepID=A0ABN9CW90_9NEOB|nr:unnamed protein product [Staurois parvus]
MAEVCGDGDSSNGRPVQGPMRHCWTWQQHEEAVRGAMADYGPGSSNGRPVGSASIPMTKWTASSSVRRPESGTWQSVENGDQQQWGGRTGNP